MAEYDDLTGSLRAKQREARELSAELDEKRVQVGLCLGPLSYVCWHGFLGSITCGGLESVLEQLPWALLGQPCDKCHIPHPASTPRLPTRQAATLAEELARRERELAGVRSALATEGDALGQAGAQQAQKAMELASTTAALQVG